MSRILKLTDAIADVTDRLRDVQAMIGYIRAQSPRDTAERLKAVEGALTVVGEVLDAERLRTVGVKRPPRTPIQLPSRIH